MIVLPIEDDAAQRAMTAMLLNELCKDLPASFVSAAEKQCWLDMAAAQQRISEHLGLPDVAAKFSRLALDLANIPVVDPLDDVDRESGSYDYEGYIQ